MSTRDVLGAIAANTERIASTHVVVLGSGYVGAGAISRLEEDLDSDTDLTWISKNNYHFLHHESHRIIRDETIKNRISIPVNDIKSSDTNFIQGTVTNVNINERTVVLEDERTVDYDYVLVALGSDTTFYSIDGIAENALTLKSRDDAVEIHNKVRQTAKEATREDPATVVVGGTGLSAIQSAGEVAEFRDSHNSPIEIVLVDPFEEIFSHGDAEIQDTLRYHLEKADVDILTNDPIDNITDNWVKFDEHDALEYDIFLWAGSVTGRSTLSGFDLKNQHNRFEVGQDSQTENERVIFIGDSTVIDQSGEHPVPPTPQAAWQAANAVADNITNAIEGHPLKQWTYDDHGTLISIGKIAISHNLNFAGIDAPVQTFGATPAKFLKKGVTACWLANITNWQYALNDRDGR